jgi:excisionase family DNA binding protein
LSTAQQLSVDHGITVRQAAPLLGVSVPCVNKLIASGELPSYKAGAARRILLSEVRAFQRGGRSDHVDYWDTIRALVDAASQLSQAQRDTLAALLADDGDAM